MSVAGDIIDDLKFRKSDTAIALSGVFGLVAISAFIMIGILGTTAASDGLIVQANNVSMDKTASTFAGGVQ